MSREPKYKNLEVFRSNSVIEQSSNFTLIEQKLILTAIAQHRKSDSDFFEYNFGVNELASLFGVSPTNLYSPLKDVSKLLTTRSLGYADDKKKEFAFYPLVSVVRFENGELTFRFNTELKPLLLDLGERYTKLQLDTMVKLKSKHSIRLYELVMIGQNKYNKRGSWEMSYSIDEFKDLMGLFTIPNKKKGEKKYRYPDSNNLKRKVLEPSIKEIQESTDISISLELKKKSRKVAGLVFHIEKKKPKITPIKTRVTRDEIDNPYSNLSEAEKAEVDIIVNQQLKEEPALDFLQDLKRTSLRNEIARSKFSHNY